MFESLFIHTGLFINNNNLHLWLVLVCACLGISGLILILRLIFLSKLYVKTDKRTSGNAPYSAIYILGVLGVLFSVSAFGVIYEAQSLKHRKIFNRQARAEVALIKRELQELQKALITIQRFYFSSKNVTQEEFMVFSHVFIDKHSGIEAIGWFEKIGNNYRIRYVLPKDNKKNLLLSNMSSLISLPEQAKASLNRKKPTISELKNIKGPDNKAFALMYPTYKTAEREEENNVFGALFLFLDLDKFAAFLQESGLLTENSIIITKIKSGEVFLEINSLNTLPNNITNIYNDDINFFDKHWRITIISHSNTTLFIPAFISFGTLIFTIIFCYYLRTLIKQRIKAEEYIRVRTAELQESIERNTLILNGSNTGIWEWNIKTNNISFSDRYCDLLGYQPSEMPTNLTSLIDLIHPDDYMDVKEAMEKHLKDNTPFRTEYRLLNAQSQYCWFEAKGQALWDDKGTPLKMVGSISDIHDKKLAEKKLADTNIILEDRIREQTEDLRLAMEQAQAASVAKSDFLANMSHEIRTPLNGIIGLSKTLLKTKLTKRQKKFAEAVTVSSESLLHLINDILDLSKIEANEVTLETQSVNLTNLIKKILQPFLITSKNKDIDLYIKNGISPETHVELDMSKFSQIINNLIGNAIKFTKKGHVSVTISEKFRDENYIIVYFEIKDTGIGIPKKYQEYIFNKFTQGQKSITTQYGGTGLGLTITKNLVELMDGEIGFESKKGKGSCFWFDLPLEISFSREEIRSDTVSKKSIIGRTIVQDIHILAVDDHDINQLLIETLLEDIGIKNLDLAANGAKAIELAKSKKYDLIIMDCQMPEMNGFEATTIIRKKSKNKDTPIIALTADAVKGTKEECLACGMNDYLSKPLNEESFFNLLSKHLHMDTNMVPDAPLTQCKKVTSEKKEKTLNHKQFNQFVGSNNINHLNLIKDTYFSQFEDTMKEIQKLHPEDKKTLSDLAHKLRGASSSIGAEKLARIFHALERNPPDDHMERDKIFKRVYSEADILKEKINSYLL